MLKQQLIEAAFALASLAITALAGIATAAVTRWLNTKTATSKVAAITLTVWEKALRVVAFVSKEGGADLRGALADGKVSREEGERLKIRAMHLLLEALGQEGIDELRDVLGIGADALTGYLSGVIEGALGDFKNPAIPNAPTVASLPVSKPG